MKEKRVFDFTDIEALSTNDKLDYGQLNKKRKEYTVGPVIGDTIIVSIVCYDNTAFDCVYRFREVDDIHTMIKNGEPLHLEGSYIFGFYFNDTAKHKLIELHAEFSFWDGDVSFEEATFGDGYVSFDGANFGDGNINFEDTSFGEGVVNFSRVNFGNGDTSFFGANFGNGDVNFYDTQLENGNINFNGAAFGDGDIRFGFSSFINGETSFLLTTFGNGDISFEMAHMGKVTFTGNQFKSIVDMRFKDIQELKIQDCTIEKILKVDGFPQVLSFLNTINLGQIYIDWWNCNVYKSISNSTYNADRPDQFRMLKENYHTIGDYDAEDNAYRAYMKCKTSDKWYRWPLKFFSLVGGYGTQPFTIILAMLAAWIAFAAVYTFFLAGQFDLSSVKSFSDALYYSGITFLTIGYGDIAPAVTGTALRFVSIAEGFVGLFLMSYLTVAVVRKILR